MHREFDIVDGNNPCPEMFVLQNYAVGGLSDLATRQAVQAHVPSCAICADIVRRLRGNALPNEGIVNLLETRTKRRWEMRQRLTAQEPEPGTIWRTIPEVPGQASGPLVLILSKPRPWADEVLSVVEISREISQAIEDDIILERGDTDLPFRCMVRTSNRFPTSRSFLDVCIGKLPEHWMPIVYQVCDPLQRFDNDTGFNEDEFVCDGYGNPLMRRRGVTSGVPVTDEQDPRLAFLRESMHKRRYLSREVKAARRRREEEQEHALLPDTQAAAPAEPEPARRQWPPWLRVIRGGAEHRGGAQPWTLAAEPVVIAAQQQGAPGWPLAVEVDVEGLSTPLRLKVDRLGFDFVLEGLGPPEARDVVVCLDHPAQEIVLNADTLVSLGPLKVFGLTSESSADDIINALTAAGFSKPRIRKTP